MAIIKRSKGITIFALLLILYVVFKPAAAIQSFIIAEHSDQYLEFQKKHPANANLIATHLTAELKDDILYQSRSLKAIRHRVLELNKTLPVYYSNLPPRLNFLLSVLILLVSISLLISALGLLNLSDIFRKITLMIVGVVIALNLLNLICIFPMAPEEIAGSLIEMLRSVVKLMFFGSIIYYFTRPMVVRQFKTSKT